ncbi:MAG TPA: hypothetical protein EYN46_04700, partial [Candidatus Poseidoniales archaeon]|nr:hypothetical protein [Candidatus Poseidoniales archaeon]
NSSLNATNPDACPDEWGNSTFDRLGCLDSDGDGMSDLLDDFPLDAERTSDVDLDGLDDLFDDNCPNTHNPQQDDLDEDGIGDACDTDDDGDGKLDGIDSCPRGAIDWTSVSFLDYDEDGCRDSLEDSDDDGDGIDDGMDSCPRGDLGWSSNKESDHDSDGCNDVSEDLDDDNDGKMDYKDDCPRGMLGWDSSESTDRDSDGCFDSNEDLDDDNDGVEDDVDMCPQGIMQWTSDEDSDVDSDGCKDGLEIASVSDVEEMPENFLERLMGGDLDAIGVSLAIILPVIGITLSIILRMRKTSIVKTLSRRIDKAVQDSELDDINAILIEHATKERISQTHYDILKAKLYDRRTSLQSLAFNTQGGMMASMRGASAPSSAQRGQVSGDGYEWLNHHGSKWYRTAHSGDHWKKWEK